MSVDANIQAERESIFLRVLWMMVLAIGWQVAELLLIAVALVQLLHRLIRGHLHQPLLRFGGSLGFFLGQTARYLSFASDEKPWPFAAWPEPQVAVPTVAPAAESSTKVPEA